LPARSTVAVLGAGIQGACAALAVAQRGHAVVLVDQAPRCLDRASLRNEGKIHLGHVYARDASFATADLILRGALSFAPLLDDWTPDEIDWAALRSNPFCYLVARDSQVGEEQLHAHYSRIEATAVELQSADPRLHYLGRSLDRLWRPAAAPRQVNPALVCAAVRTPEASVDLVGLRSSIADALDASDHIDQHYGHRVDRVVRRDHGFEVAGRTLGGERWRRRVDLVVNALWDGRLAIDAQLGLAPDRPWVHRLKHRVVGRTPPALHDLPSFTIVLGPFGDVVTRPYDDFLYLSWYPVCMTGWSQAAEPPEAWRPAMSGQLDVARQQPIIDDTLAAFDELVPGLGAATDTTADGGVIFSWGDSDIEDTRSELHRRSEIDTGKLTTAPLFADQLARLLS
jgi:glycine/D-amino acid oxidase-like deaminating enzyme